MCPSVCPETDPLCELGGCEGQEVGLHIRLGRGTEGRPTLEGQEVAEKRGRGRPTLAKERDRG